MENLNNTNVNKQPKQTTDCLKKDWEIFIETFRDICGYVFISKFQKLDEFY